ncbi:hypothetical protein VTK73DRAFT_5071 [Phialemonium thermophilum]|uniref:Uncharacterized protein n=1 Tax=Phialemonium thermophilum TaxID=223376 RepID=A0ABR3V3Q9_9PEZI
MAPPTSGPPGDGTLAGPEEARAEAAGDGAHEHKPDGAEAVVGVQAGAVDGVAHGAQAQRPVEADAVGDGPAEEAQEAHDAEDQRVGGVDQVRFLGAAGTQRVHGVPQAGGDEAHAADDEGIPQRRVIPGAVLASWGEVRRRGGGGGGEALSGSSWDNLDRHAGPTVLP